MLYVTHRGRLPTSGDIDDYNAWVRWEAEQAYSDPIIRGVSKDIKAVVCTAADDARTNTGMAGAIGVPIHWLDGGGQDRPTLIANSYLEFYGDEWVNHDWGAYVTGNSAYFHENAMIWTGCDSKGVAHPSFPMGATSAMDMVAVGTPRDSAANHAPLDAVDVDSGHVTGNIDEYKSLYAISPIFTVVGGVPAEPQNVTGTAGGGQVTLRWDRPEHDGGYDITGYRVYWRNPSNGYRWESFQGVMLKADAWTTTNDNMRGYNPAQTDSSLSATTFEYAGVTYTVKDLITLASKTNSADIPDLYLTLSPVPPAAARAALTLEIPSSGSFALSDATVDTTSVAAAVIYKWTDAGVTWADGQRDFFVLRDADGNAVMDLVDVEVDGDTTTWTDVNDRNRIYGVSAVNEAGKSSRARFVCAVGNGCRLPPTPVVKISSDSPLVPSGLRSGDRFRLIFLSSTQRNADPTDIYYYNKFVQDRAAAGHADIRAHSAGFRAVACTEAVDARDNTGTNGIGLGIWWLGDAKAVDNYVDFYDGSWDEEATVRDESGAAVTIPLSPSQYAAWTGCEHDGTEAFETGDSIALGTTTPVLGSLNHGGSRGPLHQSGGSDPKAQLNYLYGLSYIFEVR